MTFGASEVPILAARGPVQPITCLDVLARIQMEPALAPLPLRPRIPRDGERLLAAAGKFDQVLLQRMHTERVFDLVIVEPAVGSVGVDEELAVAA
jgi:hypothetical protein